jgi:hypothetical protein
MQMQKEGSLLVMERLVEGWRFAYGSFLVFYLVYGCFDVIMVV